VAKNVVKVDRLSCTAGSSASFDRRHTGCKEKYRNFKSCLRALTNSAAKFDCRGRAEGLENARNGQGDNWKRGKWRVLRGESADFEAC